MLGDVLGCGRKQEELLLAWSRKRLGVMKHPTVHRTARMTKDYLSTSVVLRLRN